MSEVPLYPTAMSHPHMHGTVKKGSASGERALTRSLWELDGGGCLMGGGRAWSWSKCEAFSAQQSLDASTGVTQSASPCNGDDAHYPMSRDPGWTYAPGSSLAVGPYRGTSLIRNRLLIGPYSRAMPRAIR